MCRERESYSINGPRERERGGTSPERFRLLSTLHHQLLPFSFSRHRKRRRAHYLRWRPTPHRFHRPAHLIMHNRVGYNPATKCNRLVLLLRTHTAYIRKKRRGKKNENRLTSAFQICIGKSGSTAYFTWGHHMLRTVHFSVLSDGNG